MYWHHLQSLHLLHVVSIHGLFYFGCNREDCPFFVAIFALLFSQRKRFLEFLALI